MSQCNGTFEDAFFDSDELVLNKDEFNAIQDNYKVSRKYTMAGFWLDQFIATSVFISLFGMALFGIYYLADQFVDKPFSLLNAPLAVAILFTGVVTGIMRCAIIPMLSGVSIFLLIAYASSVLTLFGASDTTISRFTISETDGFFIGIVSFLAGVLIAAFIIDIWEAISGLACSTNFHTAMTRKVKAKIMKRSLVTNVGGSPSLRPLAKLYGEKEARKELEALSDKSPEVKAVLDSIQLQGRPITNGEAYKIIKKYNPAWKTLSRLAPERNYETRQDKCIECSIKRVCGIKPGGMFESIYREKRPSLLDGVDK
ncbi:hypothetical protein A3715_19245 [Oleiphilus sp. HI0009]|nr:hypothetical protein A3715_19245 [Oleiphilus sp. HI0009]